MLQLKFLLAALMTAGLLALPSSLVAQQSDAEREKDKKELLQGYHQKPGVIVPHFLPTLTVQDTDGNDVNLNAVFGESDFTVLKIVRGDWSLRCTNALSELGKSQEKLAEYSAQLVVLSPEKPLHAQRQIESAIGDEDFELTLYIDNTTQVIRELHIAERLKDRVIVQFEKALRNKREYQTGEHPNASGEWVTPVTATVIIDKSGSVIWLQASWDTKQQATPEEVLEALQSFLS